MENSLPSIPAKRYFTISEVGDLCGVKPHVLRYWEQEFTQLRPMKRSGNRRYYQHNEVLMIRRIRELLYDQGFTIHGARNQMQEMGHAHRGQKHNLVSSEFEVSDAKNGFQPEDEFISDEDALDAAFAAVQAVSAPAKLNVNSNNFKWQLVRQELHEIRELLGANSLALQL
jgi:DNA-binding transcriptional MerR regulator